jgi:hypothetical protein
MKAVISIAVAASLVACTASEQHDAGTQICTNTGQCIHADFYAACYHSGALVPVQIVDGGTLTPAPISARPPDGGGNDVPAYPQSLLFTDAGTVWMLDTQNNQIDVINVGVWPPLVTASVATGASPNQLLACDGMVISINSTDNTIQGIDPVTLKTLHEVNVGMGENPFFGACDGQHTLYVSDWAGGDVKAVNLSTFLVVATFTVPAQYIAQSLDGGPVTASPEGVAFYQSGDGGGMVFLALENLDQSYTPTGPGNVLVIDPTLARVLVSIDPGPSCLNPSFLMPAPNGTELLEACGGVFFQDAGPSEVVRIRPSDQATTGTIAVPFTNPGRMAVLKDGLVAIADQGASGGVAVFNPGDGGLVGVFYPCPPRPDAGLSYEFVADVAAAP